MSDLGGRNRAGQMIVIATFKAGFATKIGKLQLCTHLMEMNSTHVRIYSVLLTIVYGVIIRSDQGTPVVRQYTMKV